MSGQGVLLVTLDVMLVWRQLSAAGASRCWDILIRSQRVLMIVRGCGGLWVTLSVWAAAGDGKGSRLWLTWAWCVHV